MTARIATFAALLLCWQIVVGEAWAGGADRRRVHVEGGGPVTVVFEAGLGDTLDVWREVQLHVSRACTRTFSYNRAGYPGSGSAKGERDAVRIVEELRAELRSRDIQPPYLLVGHSLGGLYMQYFARNHAEDVVGLVLVDSTHWEQLARMKEESPGMYGTLSVFSILMTGTMRHELRDSVGTGQEVESSPALGSIPTIVLSSTRAAPGETPAFRGLMRKLQNEQAAQYDARRHEFVADSGHYIQRDRPEVVIAAIRELAGCE
jgi:pimeloyl-ACP methyl ester carboxylesterase